MLVTKAICKCALHQYDIDIGHEIRSNLDEFMASDERWSQKLTQATVFMNNLVETYGVPCVFLGHDEDSFLGRAYCQECLAKIMANFASPNRGENV